MEMTDLVESKNMSVCCVQKRGFLVFFGKTWFCDERRKVCECQRTMCVWTKDNVCVKDPGRDQQSARGHTRGLLCRGPLIDYVSEYFAAL